MTIERAEDAVAGRVAGLRVPRHWRFVIRAAALLLPLLTCAVLAGFHDTVTSATAALVVVLWVVAAAATGDRPAGLLAALSGAVWFDFFLTEPYHRFSISDADDVEVTVLLLVIGGLVTEVALWGHRQQARAARRTGYLDGVLGTARVVSEGATPAPALIDIVARQITEVLDAQACRFVAGRCTTHVWRFSTTTAPSHGTAGWSTSTGRGCRTTRRSRCWSGAASAWSATSS